MNLGTKLASPMADFVAYNEMMKRCRVSTAEAPLPPATGFTPCLPDDVFLNCLLRVPLQCHASLHLVSKSLRALLQSPEYYAQRQSEGASSSFVCMLQRTPTASEESGEAVRDEAREPVFGITLLDVEHATWERLPAIPGLAGGLPTFSKLVRVGRELVVMGGWWQTTWAPSVSVFIYNFGTQKWRQGKDMPNARSFFACGVVGSKVLLAGGHDGDKKALNSVESYDVATNSWTSLRSMNFERDEPTGVIVDWQFYVVSGYGSDAQGVFTASAEVYDPETNSWRVLENMWTPTDGGDVPVNLTSLAALKGSVYAVRGKEVAVYDSERNAWTVVAKMPEECEKAEMTSTSIAAAGNELVITGLVKKNGVTSLRTLKLTPPAKNGKPQWETVACSEQFLNLAQTSCAFEL